MRDQVKGSLILTWLLLPGCLVLGELACSADSAPSAVSPLTLSAPATRPAADAGFHVDIKQSIEFLASDPLEGRLIGTPGIDRAAGFIADSFGKLGLRAAPGLNDYFQSFKMTTRVDPDPAKTAFVVGRQSLKLETDFIPLRGAGEGAAEGAAVFAGYGISDPQRHYDDYAGLDVKGKIVLVMRYEPHTKDGKSQFAGKDEDWSADATIPKKVTVATAHGASAVILVNSALHHDDELKSLISFSRRYPFGASTPVAQVTVEAADAMLRQGGLQELKSLQAEIDQTLTSHSAALKDVSVRLSVGIRKTEKPVENVVAMLPGQGPQTNEYVIIGAHYDHLGHGGAGSLAPWSHGIHHGADDNASGTTAMMALADRFAHLGPQARTLVFIAFTGEEEGLIGSAYFAEHSPVPLQQVAAMLNLDMVGRVSSEKLLIGGKGTAAVFPKMVEDADQGLPLKLGEFGKGGIGPSDHATFALKKIPVLFFFSGLHLDYHRPTDTADKINFRGMDEVVELGERVVKAMTTMPRQAYNGSYDASGLAQMDGGPTTRQGPRATMGAIPDYAQPEDVTTGMRIGGIMEHSPAQKAGLRAGDIISQFNDQKISNMFDYTSALEKAKPNQQVKLKVLRDGKSIDIDATLGRKD